HRGRRLQRASRQGAGRWKPLPEQLSGTGERAPCRAHLMHEGGSSCSCAQYQACLDDVGCANYGLVADPELHVSPSGDYRQDGMVVFSVGNFSLKQQPEVVFPGTPPVDVPRAYLDAQVGRMISIAMTSYFLESAAWTYHVGGLL